MAGPIGLNYVAVECVMRMTAIPLEKQPEYFESIRLIESGFLAALNERKKNVS